MRSLAIAATGAVTAAALIAAHLAPAVTGITPLVRGVSPCRAGMGRQDRVAITFDDGPHPEGTPAVLRVLDEFDCTATFFLVAEQVHRHPHVARAVSNSGHEIAIHGWSHRPLPTLGPRATARQLEDAADLVATVTGAEPRWFRPPYGVATTGALRTAKKLGLQTVWWSRWGRDWDVGATADSVAQRVLRSPETVGGATVLLHDSDSYGHRGSWRVTAAALSIILADLHDRDLRAGPLRDHDLAELTNTHRRK